MVKTLTISQKLAAVRWAETNSVSAPARKSEVDPKRIREWIVEGKATTTK